MLNVLYLTPMPIMTKAVHVRAAVSGKLSCVVPHARLQDALTFQTGGRHVRAV